MFEHIKNTFYFFQTELNGNFWGRRHHTLKVVVGLKDTGDLTEVVLEVIITMRITVKVIQEVADTTWITAEAEGVRTLTIALDLDLLSGTSPLVPPLVNSRLASCPKEAY